MNPDKKKDRGLSEALKQRTPDNKLIRASTTIRNGKIHGFETVKAEIYLEALDNSKDRAKVYQLINDVVKDYGSLGTKIIYMLLGTKKFITKYNLEIKYKFINQRVLFNEFALIYKNKEFWYKKIK